MTSQLDASNTSSSLEELTKSHRKQQKDLQARITQKKKSATKKTRKGINDECAMLEKELKDRQDAEIAALNTPGASNGGSARISNSVNGDLVNSDDLDNASHDSLLDSIVQETTGLEESTKQLNISKLKQNPETLADESTLSQNPKKNRQKQRLARRAAEQDAIIAQAKQEAADMPDAKQIERKSMLEHFEKRGLREHVVAANGHCLFLAVADQLQELGVDPSVGTSPRHEGSEPRPKNEQYKDVREAAAAYMSAHPDDFEPFLEEPLNAYLSKIRDTAEWGGQLELMALAKTYGLDINVLQANGQVERIEGDRSSNDNGAWLAYYRRGFGLGEHYNSLRKAIPAKSST